MMEDEKMKRPRGVTILSILWVIGGLYNLYVGGSAVIYDVSLLKQLSGAPKWFRFAVPVEIVLSLIAFIFGIVQMYVVYGLWTGKSWAHRPALVIPIFGVIMSVLIMIFYMTCPSELFWLLGISIPSEVGALLAYLVVTAIVLVYLNKPHVKEYLMVQEET